MAQQNIRAVPRHIAIIMDGNGRWAAQRGLPRTEGHRQGAMRVREVARACAKRGVEFLTLYAFSTENWKRPADEIDAIMNLLRRYLDEAEKYRKENIRTRFLGERSALAPDLVEKIERVEAESASCTGMTLNIALNYGGRDEIVHAARALAGQVRDGSLAPDAITEEVFSSALFTAGEPDPDLLLRPSGEKRLSNFLLWQCAYAEFVFQDVLWPDFTEEDLDRAIEIYSGRNRRFGGI